MLSFQITCRVTVTLYCYAKLKHVSVFIQFCCFEKRRLGAVGSGKGKQENKEGGGGEEGRCVFLEKAPLFFCFCYVVGKKKGLQYSSMPGHTTTL